MTSATATLSGLGLKVRGEIPRTNPAVAGTVLNVSPPVGHTVKAGDYVELVTSSGPAMPVTVPPVVGLTLSSANEQLSAVGLSEHVKYVNSWNVAVVPGTVLQQSPLGSTTANSGTFVVLTLLNSTGTFPLPNLSGDGVAQAGAALGRFGLVPGSSTQSVCASGVATGNVVSTNPGSGSPVSAGDTVNLTVSTGQCPVPVPDVIGETIPFAESQLTGASLQPQVSQCPSGQSSLNTVAAQSISPPQKVPPGTVITLTPACSGSSTTTTSTTMPTGATIGVVAHTHHVRPHARGGAGQRPGHRTAHDAG